MNARGVHHVSINVADLAAALPFYVEVLGFEPIPRPDFGFPGAWLAIGGPGGQQLHLIETGERHVGHGEHFAVAVRGIDEICAELRAGGIEVSDPMAVPGAGRQAFLQDPSGNLIELNEPRS